MKIDEKYNIEAVNPDTGETHSEDDSILFLARDKAVPATLDFYLGECLKLGREKEHIEGVRALRERVIEFQSKEG